MTKVLGFESDAYGKYHEVMTAKFLTGEFPERPKVRQAFLDNRKLAKASKSKYDTSSAENFIASLLDHHKITDADKAIHDQKAQSAADYLRNYFHDYSQSIERVFWTSNPLDMVWLIGPDSWNTADIAVKTRGRGKTTMTGISIKNFHKKRSVATYYNPGHGALDELFKTTTIGIAEFVRNKVFENAKKFGLDISRSIKQLHEDEKAFPELIDINDQIMVDACQQIAAIYRQQVKDASEQDVQNILMKLLSGQSNKISTLVLRSYGLTDFNHDIHNQVEDVERIYELHKGNLGVKNSTGRSVLFTGKNDVGIAALGIKTKSGGGFTTICGRVDGIFQQALQA